MRPLRSRSCSCHGIAQSLGPVVDRQNTLLVVKGSMHKCLYRYANRFAVSRSHKYNHLLLFKNKKKN